jgi:hypothetical protein
MDRASLPFHMLLNIFGDSFVRMHTAAIYFQLVLS